MADSAADVRKVVAVLRDRGFVVEEVPGWESRGRGPMTTTARVEHHTAGSRHGDSPSLRVVTFGRAGLRNSLSRWFVSRTGKIYLVALNTSWHAGRGIKTSNSRASGTEAQHSGSSSEPWTEGSLAAQRAISQAECAVFGVSHSNVWDHREHAPGRKIDRISIDSDAWRRSLAADVSTQPIVEVSIVADLKTFDLTGVTRDKRTWLRSEGLDFAQLAVSYGGFAPANTLRLDSRGNVTADGVGGPGTRAAVMSANRAMGRSGSAVVDDRLYRFLLRQAIG